MTAPAAPPADPALHRFLDGVCASGILSPRQLERALASLPPPPVSPRTAADHFVRNDWLTRFQADRLLAGKPDGFLLGPYVILDFLGRSPSARVYQARHRTMNRQVAVHVLRSEFTASEMVREGIRGQARTAARLAHPNVLTLLDVNTAGDRMYMVHEFVDGADLGATVRANGPLAVPRACDLARQIAAGLQHAHEKHTPHGRLCPEAVLVGRPGGNGPTDKPVAKVAGLGLGAFAGDRRAGAYTAPEAAADPTSTPAADLYALGAMLHLLLVGRPPAGGVMCGSLVIRADVPAGLAAVVAALLNANPHRRPASAADVAAALEAFAADDGPAVSFDLPPVGPASAATLTGGSGVMPSLPVVDTLLPDPPADPWADLADPDDAERSTDTLRTDRASRTPVSTPRPKRRAKTRRKARRRSTNAGLWWGLAAVGVVLLAVTASVAALVSVLR